MSGWDMSEEYRRGLLAAAAVIRSATGLSPDRVASDLEDIAAAYKDPARCGHPFWRPHAVSGVVCRSCGTDQSRAEAMGA